jgi:acetate kinase
VARAILVVNAGSSSVKLSVFADEEPPRRLARRRVDSRLDERGVIEDVLAWCRSAIGEHRLTAIGHRVVHGGPRFSRPVVIDRATLGDIEALTVLAPLHQPHNVAAIKALARAAPGVTQVACFDTAFHRTQPRIAQLFALPRRFAEEGILRYGFHGLSYEYIASVLPKIDAAPRRVARSSCTSGTARACARSPRRRASRRR